MDPLAHPSPIPAHFLLPFFSVPVTLSLSRRRCRASTLRFPAWQWGLSPGVASCFHASQGLQLAHCGEVPPSGKPPRLFFCSSWLTCSYRRVTKGLRVRTLTVARNPPLARPLFMGPATGGGMAATFSLADKAVGSACIAGMCMDEVNTYPFSFFFDSVLMVPCRVTNKEVER